MFEKLMWMTGKVFDTLDRHKKFTVREVTPNAVNIRVHSTNEERRISMNDIERAWNKLITTGIIRSTEILEFPCRSSAYISTMLAHLDGVTYSLRPIILRHK